MEEARIEPTPTEIAVYPDERHAAQARADVLAAGVPPSELRVLGRKEAEIARNFDGPPIPEVLAGALVGACAGLVPAVVPGFAPYLPWTIAAGALIVGAASWPLALRQRIVVPRDLEEGECALVVSPLRERAERVHEALRRHGPRRLERRAA